MSDRWRAAAWGAVTGVAVIALSVLASVVVSWGWDYRRAGVFMAAAAIVALVLALGGIVSSGMLGRWRVRNEAPEDIRRREETSWFVLTAAVTIFVLWLLLGPAQL